jgi:hypothetical protein
VAVEEFFDLARVDVLAAADDQVLDPPDDVHVAVVAHDGEIAGVHPARRIDGGVGRRNVLPVPEHDRIAARTELARCAARRDRAGFRIDDLAFEMRVNAPDR